LSAGGSGLGSLLSGLLVALVILIIFLTPPTFLWAKFVAPPQPVAREQETRPVMPATPAASATNFTLTGLDGKSHALSDYRGKVVFLNFWATWCPPCRAEMPSMQKLYLAWDQTRYVMLTVNLRETKEVVRAFADKNGYTFPILLDETGAIASQYRVSGIPTTLIINENGTVVNKTVGSREWTLEALKQIAP
jgi:peroxiredoxin